MTENRDDCYRCRQGVCSGHRPDGTATPLFVIRSAVCPGCGGTPAIMMERQFFCGDDDCKVLTWDPADDPATIMRTATVIDLDGTPL